MSTLLAWRDAILGVCALVFVVALVLSFVDATDADRRERALREVER